LKRYNCFEKETEIYICSVYTYTDLLNLKQFLEEKGIEIFTRDVKMGKRAMKNIWNANKTKDATSMITSSETQPSLEGE
jgi:SepF-like predicted cell division protein (DUF552 family)